MHLGKSVILYLTIVLLLAVLLLFFVSKTDIVEDTKNVDVNLNSNFEGQFESMSSINLKPDHFMSNSLGSSQPYPLQQRQKRDLARFHDVLVFLPKHDVEINEFRYKVGRKPTNAYIAKLQSEYELCQMESVLHEKCTMTFMKLFDFRKEISHNMKRMNTIQIGRNTRSKAHLKFSSSAEQVSNATAYLQSDDGIGSSMSAMSLTVSHLTSTTLSPFATTVVYHVEVQQIATKQIQKSEKIKPAISWMLEGGVEGNRQRIVF